MAKEKKANGRLVNELSGQMKKIKVTTDLYKFIII